jgi:hypothetical protein
VIEALLQMTVDVTSVGAAAQVTGAIRQAAHSTGASFDYLLATARLESNLNPAAQAPTSSASGLFQFIEQTWLGTMKASGASLGFGAYADAVSFNAATGRYDVADPGMRQAIMALRNDASASAAMAGAYTRSNATQLAGALGRRPNDGELYIAHFLGPQGAERLISAATSRPDAPAAALFPAAAQANRAVFYDRAGQARGAAEVYAVLANKFDAARRSTGTAGLRGSVGEDPTSYVQDALRARLAPIPSRGGNGPGGNAFAVPDTAGVTRAYAQANRAAEQPVPDNRPLFQAMFRSGGQPIAPVVEALWSDAAASGTAGRAVAPNPVSTPARAAAVDGLNPLDFFRDARAGVRRPGSGT